MPKLGLTSTSLIPAPISGLDRRSSRHRSSNSLPVRMTPVMGTRNVSVSVKISSSCSSAPAAAVVVAVVGSAAAVASISPSAAAPPLLRWLVDAAPRSCSCNVVDMPAATPPVRMRKKSNELQNRINYKIAQSAILFKTNCFKNSFLFLFLFLPNPILFDS